MSYKHFTINERNKLEVLLKKITEFLKLLKSLTGTDLPFTVKSKELMANTLLKILSQMPVQKLLIKEETQKLLLN